MINKLILNVKSDKPLQEYGDSHVIVYDKHNNYYYVQTYTEFMSPQNEKIKKLEKEIDDLKKTCELFTKTIIQHEREFLLKYQKANSKLINLVKNVIKGDVNDEIK